MNQEQVVRALAALCPNDRWSYQGDGSTLTPHVVNGKQCRGLVWEGPGIAPTLPQLQSVLGAIALTPEPNIKGFKTWLQANMPQARRNLVRSLYCEFMENLNAKDWPAFEAGCNYVRANTDTTQLPAAAWTAFKGAITTYNIPVTLT